MTPAAWARWCGWGAVLIAVAGAIDPTMTLARSTRPIVSLIDTSQSPSLGDQVARELDRYADVERGLTAGAVAVVVTGDRLPAFADGVTVPGFVIAAESPASSTNPARVAGTALPAIDIDDLSGPTRAHMDTRVPVTASLHVIGGRGATLSVTLAVNGALLDDADRVIADDDARVQVPLTVVPTSVGPTHLHVTARLAAGATGSAARPVVAATSADALTRVDVQPWSIFVFDRRPSWMSTFVRRALEDDERFSVTSRTVTSRDVATDTPDAPGDLSAAGALARFDAIVVGAPDALTAGDVAGIDHFVRRRGGAAVYLWDVRPTGPALTLMGVDRWTSETQAADRAITLSTGAIRASDVVWPAAWPPRAEAIGRLQPSALAGAPSTAPLPVLWSAPVGSGRIVVSGALDSWRYRGAAQATFDAAWRQIVGLAADGAPPPLAISVSPAVVRPGDAVAVDVRLRDAELDDQTSPVTSTMPTTLSMRLVGPDHAADAVPVRVWPGSAPGRFAAQLSAPSRSGFYRLVASDGTVAGDADLLVDTGASPTRRHERDVLSAWATSRGGRVIDATAIADLASAIRPLAPAGSTRAPVHPMRSAWWIGPMTLLMGIEWWSRRSRGLR
jgi:hypothetical protein